MTSREFMYMNKYVFIFLKSASLQDVCNTNLKNVCIKNKIEIKKIKMIGMVRLACTLAV